MPEIKLETRIQAGIAICFDLARSIDLHRISTAGTNEIAVDGVTSGLINLDEFVTWQATHFGIRQKLTSKITAFQKPFYFRDEQVKGAFKLIQHDHFFETDGQVVTMKDVFVFRSPFGLLGTLADAILLKAYLTRLLTNRNRVIKDFAESGRWKTVLPLA